MPPPHRAPEIYHFTSVIQNLEHVNMVAFQYTLSFYYLSQIIPSLLVLDLVEPLLSLSSLAPQCLLYSTHTVAHCKLRLSASVEATGFPVILVRVRPQSVLLGTEFSMSFLVVPV